MGLLLLFQAALLARAARGAPTLPLKIETRSPLNSRLANIHLEHQDTVKGTIEFTYGPCETTYQEQTIWHPVGRTRRPSHNRLIWIIPDNAVPGGCIAAWSGSTGLLVGRSEPQIFDPAAIDRSRDIRELSRRGMRMDNSTGIDVWGPWFEGVELLKNRAMELAAVDAASAKRKKIAIVGAGMSGLMTYLCLIQQGMTNVHLIEAGGRLGGRVRTVYLSGGPFDYSYQEMGPMRLPTTITVDNDTFNISDHQLYEMNVNMHHMDGLPGMERLLQEVNTALPGKDFCVEMARNMFKAHRKWLDSNLNDLPREPWSEYAFMVNYLQKNLKPDDTLPRSIPRGASSFWDKLCETVYLNSTTWTTIDGGMNRLPLSFQSLVDNATTFNRQINRVKYSPGLNAVILESKDNGHTKLAINSTHDYAILAVPFSVMKNWEIDGLDPVMRDAIATLPYTSACKEHGSRPVFGSCWAPGRKFPGVGTICYPSYNINGTGMGAVLASYISGPVWGDHWATKSEREHVAYVLNTMYTGKHSRVCWDLDPLEAGGWADPTAEQQRLYLPEYFKTHNNVIFVGEHTSYTHAWIASALESGIRGSVQLLLELGLIDEAKAVVERWMARWIDVVMLEQKRNERHQVSETRSQM
ncbi:hypothetical protein B0T14DRAFT_545565 [Immersiella caudata]|uniref:Amine oxidase domain-containing protein n=1 Tax=Immersiella caudata TaxID=314043 RepID=A0AA39WPG8_9PEZI|nr:hypothetical protein B0T14DRAFT_545565 [Immersiella caudata]